MIITYEEFIKLKRLYNLIFFDNSELSWLKQCLKRVTYSNIRFDSYLIYEVYFERHRSPLGLKPFEVAIYKLEDDWFIVSRTDKSSYYKYDGFDELKKYLEGLLL